jgi:hypothetical protein
MTCKQIISFTKNVLAKTSNVIAFILLALGASMSLNAQSEPAIEFQEEMASLKRTIEDAEKNIQELNLKLESLDPLFTALSHKYKSEHTYVGPKPKQTSGKYSLIISTGDPVDVRFDFQAKYQHKNRYGYRGGDKYVFPNFTNPEGIIMEIGDENVEQTFEPDRDDPFYRPFYIERNERLNFNIKLTKQFVNAISLNPDKDIFVTVYNKNKKHPYTYMEYRPYITQKEYDIMVNEYQPYKIEFVLPVEYRIAILETAEYNNTNELISFQTRRRRHALSQLYLLENGLLNPSELAEYLITIKSLSINTTIIEGHLSKKDKQILKKMKQEEHYPSDIAEHLCFVLNRDMIKSVEKYDRFIHETGLVNRYRDIIKSVEEFKEMSQFNYYRLIELIKKERNEVYLPTTERQKMNKGQKSLNSFITGSSSILGQAFLTTLRGTVKYAAGCMIHLYPATEFVTNEINAHLSYDNIKSKKDMILQEVSFLYEPPDVPFRKTVIADGNGNFEFTNIPPGEYVLVTVIAWSIGNDMVGGTILQTVTLEPDETKEIKLTRQLER